MKVNKLILGILAGLIFLIWQNNHIIISKHNYTNSKVPDSFKGFTILHISDWHNKNFHGRLLKKMQTVNPDIILITGDLIDRRKPNLSLAEKFVGEIVKIAPTYFVSGNHEELSQDYGELKKILKDHKVIHLDDSYTTIRKGDGLMGLTGIADPITRKTKNISGYENNDSYVRKKLEDLGEHIKTDFNILIAHRPEQINIYKEFNYDLVFSGHAHGGQIRIPFVGGILAPNQGFFPKYTEGIHREGSTSILISRGLGNSLFPFRIFNRPELIVVEIK